MNADNTGLVQLVATSHRRLSETPEAGPIRARCRSDGKTHAAEASAMRCRWLEIVGAQIMVNWATLSQRSG